MGPIVWKEVRTRDGKKKKKKAFFPQVPLFLKKKKKFETCRNRRRTMHWVFMDLCFNNRKERAPPLCGPLSVLGSVDARRRMMDHQHVRISRTHVFWLLQKIFKYIWLSKFLVKNESIFYIPFQVSTKIL